MLTPKQKQNLPTELTALYSELTEFILQDIARRIADGAKLTDTAEYQLYRARSLELSTKEIAAKIAEINGVAADTIERLIHSAAEQADAADRNVLGDVDGIAVPLADNEQLQKLISAQIAETNGKCENLTNTLGFADHDFAGRVYYLSMTDMYRRELDSAHMKVVTGATDYITAIRQAVNKLAASGVRTIDYESGTSRSVEAAVRTALMTSVSHVTHRISEQNGANFGADGWEMSAHSGARPSHAVYQGKQYTQEEYEQKIKPLLAEPNCRHDVYPIILGISKPVYSEQELKNIDPPPFTYEGKRYTSYQAQQQMRKMERAMRKQKNRCIVADAAGDKEGFTTASIKLRRQKDIYEDFCRKAGCYTEYERTIVGGYDRHLSGKTGAVTRKQRAFERAQMRLSDKQNSGIIEYEKISDKVAVDSDGTPLLSSDVIKKVEDKMLLIPEKHRTVIENTIKSVTASNTNGVNSYNPKTKVLKLDPNTADRAILHECGHVLADAYGIYDDPEFIRILTDDLELSNGYILENEYVSEIDDYIFFVRNKKFLSNYQGRCYIKMSDFDFNAPIDPKCMQEYISVAFEEYFENPKNLQKHDIKLYKYIERMLS